MDTWNPSKNAKGKAKNANNRNNDSNGNNSKTKTTNYITNITPISSQNLTPQQTEQQRIMEKITECNASTIVSLTTKKTTTKKKIPPTTNLTPTASSTSLSTTQTGTFQTTASTPTNSPPSFEATPELSMPTYTTGSIFNPERLLSSFTNMQGLSHVTPTIQFAQTPLSSTPNLSPLEQQTSELDPTVQSLYSLLRFPAQQLHSLATTQISPTNFQALQPTLPAQNSYIAPPKLQHQPAPEVLLQEDDFAWKPCICVLIFF